MVNDILFCLRRNVKWLIVCGAVLLIGAVCGIAVCGSVKNGWWYANRYAHVVLIVQKGSFFSVFFSTFFVSLLFSALLCLLSFSVFNYAKLALIFVSGVYFGMHAAIAVSVFGIIGIFYAVFIFFLEKVFFAFAAFLSLCAAREQGKVYGIAECISIHLPCLCVMILSLLVKCVVFFALLRLLTSCI